MDCDLVTTIITLVMAGGFAIGYLEYLDYKERRSIRKDKPNRRSGKDRRA